MKRSIMFLAAALTSGVMISRADTTAINNTINHSFFTDSTKITPPPIVRSAFAVRFPNAEVKEWTERKEGRKDSYTAYFKINRKKLYAYYNADGTWQGTGTPLKWSWDLPAAVRQAWKHSNYAAWKIIDLKRIKTSDQTLYQLHLNNSPLLDADHNYAFQDECKLIYNEKGELVRKETR